MAICIGLYSQEALAIEASEILSAISELQASYLSPAAEANIQNYVSQSSKQVVQQGLGRLLEKDRQAEHKRLKRALRRVRIDGEARDWSSRNFETKDRWDEWFPINSTRKIRARRAEFDTLSYGIVSDGRYIYVMSKPRRMPRNKKYYHVINLMSSDSRIYYSIAWTNNGNYVNEFRHTRNTSDNSWMRAFIPSGMKSAKSRVFEARVPLASLKKLPAYYHVSSVAWDAEKNAYNGIWSLSPQASLKEKYKNYALMLFSRYAEYMSLSPGNPIPIAQALADSYIYRMSEASLRETVVSDGLAMIEEAQNTESYSFQDQAKLTNLPLDEILAWSNRALLYSTQHNSWKFREILGANGEKFNEELYRFLFFDPSTFKDARDLISKYDMLVDGDLRSTMWKIEEIVANTQRYRAGLDFLKLIAESIGTEYWRNIYEEAKYEEENHLDIIGEVDGVPIYKRANYGPNFQLKYFNENGVHFGDCGDVTVMSLAISKALGIAAFHIHYDLVAENFQRVVHSFPAYYSSSNGRYMGFRSGYNIVWDWTKSGRGDLNVLYRYELPFVEWFEHFYTRPFAGTKVWGASNFWENIVSLEEWETLNSGGFDKRAGGTSVVKDSELAVIANVSD